MHQHMPARLQKKSSRASACVCACMYSTYIYLRAFLHARSGNIRSCALQPAAIVHENVRSQTTTSTQYFPHLRQDRGFRQPGLQTTDCQCHGNLFRRGTTSSRIKLKIAVCQLLYKKKKESFPSKYTPVFFLQQLLAQNLMETGIWRRTERRIWQQNSALSGYYKRGFSFNPRKPALPMARRAGRRSSATSPAVPSAQKCTVAHRWHMA